MLKIRLQRTGRTNLPTYRLVVAPHTASVKGKFIEKVGHYNPMANPHVFECNLERIRHWISHGAQPSNTVARLLKGKGVDGMDKFIVEMAPRKKKAEQQAETKAKADAPKIVDAVVPAPEEAVKTEEKK